MPFYDYQCENCGFEFEIQHSMSINPLKTCPECRQDSLIRCINLPHVYVIPGDDTCSLGTLADRNGKRLSPDAQKMMKEKFKTKKRSELEKIGIKTNKDIGHGERTDFV